MEVEVRDDFIMSWDPCPWIWYKGVKGKVDITTMIKTQRRAYSFYIANLGMKKLICMGSRGIIGHDGLFLKLADHLSSVSYEEYYDLCKMDAFNSYNIN